MCEHALNKNSVHCGGCHRDFGGVSAFDIHQAWDPFSCLEPPYRDLSLDGNKIWRKSAPIQATTPGKN